MPAAFFGEGDLTPGTYLFRGALKRPQRLPRRPHVSPPHQDPAYWPTTANP